MSGDIDIHDDILSQTQKDVFQRLAKALANTDFYLAGGTALALQIGHRASVDFDWFIPRLGKPEGLLQRLRTFEIDTEFNLWLSKPSIWILIRFR